MEMIDPMVSGSSSKPPWVVLADAGPGATQAFTLGSRREPTASSKYLAIPRIGVRTPPSKDSETR